MARKRVLIVDDEPNVRRVIRDVLERAGYEPAEAVDGPEGLAKAEDLHPDAIVLDVRIPGLDGYEVCRHLKANATTKHIPVIFLTAVEDPELNRLAYEAGAVACMTKPFRLEALMALIEAAFASAEREAKPKEEGGGSGH